VGNTEEFFVCLSTGRFDDVNEELCAVYRENA